MANGSGDLDIGIRITADAAGIALADRARQAIVAMRAELAKPAQTSALSAEADALRANLQLELDLINDSVRAKVATEEAGNRQRLAVLERGAAQARALAASFAAPQLGPQPPRFDQGTPQLNVPVNATAVAALQTVTLAGQTYTVSQEQLRAAVAATNGELGLLASELQKIVQAQESATSTMVQTGEAITVQTAEINTLIGRFQTMGKTVDVTSADAVAAYRAEGVALQQNLEDLGAKASALAQVEAATAAIERRAGATQVPIPTATGRVAGPVLDPSVASDIASRANEAIGRFAALGKTIDTTSAEAVAGFRAQGVALTENLVKLGATDAQLRAIGATVTRVERAAGAARLAPDPAPLENTLTKVPSGARTAANALSLMAGSAAAGTGSLSGMANAAGGLAFGLSQLSSSARIVAGAAGIGAVATILAVVIGLLERGTEKTREQEAALKSFGDTNESFAARSAAAARIAQAAGGKPGSTASDIDLIGLTKQVDELRKASARAVDEVRSDVGRVGTGDLLGLSKETGTLTAAQKHLLDLLGGLQTLTTGFIDGRVTVSDFDKALKELASSDPQFAKKIASLAELADNSAAAAEALRKATAIELQRRAIEASNTRGFGAVPAFVKDVDLAERRLAALRAGGPVALASFDEEQKAIEKASEAWDQYVTTTKEGSKFAGIAFRDAKNASTEAGTAARAILATARAQVGNQGEAQDLPKRLAAVRAANSALAVLEAERLHGEVAAQRESIAQELKNKIQAINDDAALEGVRGTLIARARTEAADKLAKIDKDQRQKAAALFEDLSASTSESLAPVLNQVQRATDEANKKRRDEQKLIDQAVIGDEAETAQTRVDLAIAADQRRDATIFAARRDASEQLKKIAADEEADLLQQTGRGADARRLIIQREFEERAKEIQARTPAGPRSTDEQARVDRANTANDLRRQADLARVGLDELQTQSADVMHSLDTDLQRTQALAVSGALTERQARDQVVAAYERARQELGLLLPNLEAVARATGDPAAIRNVEELKTKYVELGNTIASLRDPLTKLKLAGREAAQSAIEGLLVGATKLGTQDKTEIHALTTELASAKQELEELLAIPAAARTALQNQRITELRGEVEQVSVGLDNAKQAITSWRDLFVQAAQSIIDALVKVSAQMLATQAIESLLGFVAGVAVSGAKPAAVLSGDVPAGNIVAAAGGFITGPGTSTSDSIPARLSAGEFVMRAAAVRAYGVDTMHAINAGFANTTLPPIRPRPRVGFAEGGLVSTAAIAQSGAGSGGGEFVFRFEHHPDGVVKLIKSPAGVRAVVDVIGDHKHGVRAALDY